LSPAEHVSTWESSDEFIYPVIALFPSNGRQHLKVELCGFRRLVIEALYQLNGQSLTFFRDPTLLHRHAHSLKEMIRPTGHILHMGSNSGFRDFDAFCPAPLV
jgi:hypothetical protein